MADVYLMTSSVGTGSFNQFVDELMGIFPSLLRNLLARSGTFWSSEFKFSYWVLSPVFLVGRH